MHKAYVIHRGARRKARGFTCAEGTEAGLTCADWSALKLPWDSRRKTKIAENVAYLKGLKKTK